MAHYAEIKDNVVLQVLVTDNTWTEEQTVAWLEDKISTNMWLKCSYNGNIRGVYPGPGHTYNPELDVFVAPEVVDIDEENV